MQPLGPALIFMAIVTPLLTTTALFPFPTLFTPNVQSPYMPMTGTKRRAEDTAEATKAKATKVAKAHKTDDVTNGNGAEKTKLSADEFKARALPLHVQLTHTPPSIRHEGNVNEDGSEEHAPAQIGNGEVDVGAIGSLTLVPSTFSTGSYGWKGSKRIVVELQAGEEDAEGHREKVQVMLSINATALGSKPDKSKASTKGKKNETAADEEKLETQGEEDKIQSAEDLEDSEA